MRAFNPFRGVMPDFFLESRPIWASLRRQINFPSPGSFLTESPLRDLETVIRSCTPLIVIESADELQIFGLARQMPSASN
jgi:hypothetical protein